MSNLLPYDLDVHFENQHEDNTICGLITVTAREDCHCRKLIVQRVMRSGDDDLLLYDGEQQLLAGWDVWQGGKTYTYRFTIEEAPRSGVAWDVATIVHRVGQFNPDPMRIWPLEYAKDKPAQDDELGRMWSEFMVQLRHSEQESAQSPTRTTVRRAHNELKWGLFAVFITVMLVIAILVAPLLLQQHVLLRAGLDALEYGGSGRFRLKEIPLESGERYTIYLEYLPGFSLPSFSSTSGPNLRPPVSLSDSDERTIPNVMKWRTTYGTMTSTADKIAEFVITETARQPISLQFYETPNGSLSDYEVVIRRTRHSSPLLLLLADPTNFLLLIGLVIWILVKNG